MKRDQMSEMGQTAPDGRPSEKQPAWRRAFPIDLPQDEYRSRRHVPAMAAPLLALDQVLPTFERGYILCHSKRWRFRVGGYFEPSRLPRASRRPGNLSAVSISV